MVRGIDRPDAVTIEQNVEGVTGRIDRKTELLAIGVKQAASPPVFMGTRTQTAHSMLRSAVDVVAAKDAPPGVGRCSVSPDSDPRVQRIVGQDDPRGG